VRYNLGMKKFLIFVVFILLILVVGIFAWNSTQAEIKINTPVANQSVEIIFSLTGDISSTLLKDSTFGIEILEKSGNSIMGQVISAPSPWWGQYIAVPVHFTEQIDTSGMTSDTPTCFGAATLVVSSLYSNKISHLVLINCTAK